MDEVHIKHFILLICLSPPQNSTGSAQSGSAGTGNDMDEGTPVTAGLSCGALSQRPAV